jgi:hypothetical protein
MDGINFKSLDNLIIELKKGVDRINKGNLPREDFNSILQSARLLHERLAVLQYLTEKDLANNKSESLEIDDNIEKNQINLLDAIVEVEDNSEINKSFEGPNDSGEISQSINDMHSSTPQTSLADHFGQQPIKDLIKEIGINERFLLTENLFNGKNEDYNESVKMLNNFSNKEEALKYFKQDLAKKLHWSLKNSHVKRFIKLVERRYL